MKSYIERLYELREDNDLTQEQIGKLINVSKQNYHRYEKGFVELPIRHLITLAKYYNVSLDYICGLTDKKTEFPKKKF